MLFLNDFFFLLPEIFLGFVSVLMLLFGVVKTRGTSQILIGQLSKVFVFTLGVFGYLLYSLPTVSYCLLNYQYVSNPFIYVFKLFFVLVFFLIMVLISTCFFEERIYFSELPFLFGLFCISTFCLMSSNDFLFFYFALELQALLIYTLATLKRFVTFSAEGGLKYFVLGALSSGLLLFGVSLCYGIFGVTGFYDIKFIFLKWADFDNRFGFLVAVIFILSGLLFKLSAVPFHIWAPDVYEGAPTVFVLIFATLPKLTVCVFLVNFFFTFAYEVGELWYLLFFFSGISSVLVGTLTALAQSYVKRLYAYSAIVNVGYLLFMLGLGSLTGLVALFNYFVTYLLSTMAFFAFVLLVRKSLNGQKIKLLSEFHIYFTHHPLLAFLIGLVFFSLAGIPPLAGFFIKFFLFKTMFAESFLLSSLIFVVLFFNIASTFYYIRCVNFLFFNTSRSPVLVRELDFWTVFILVNLVVFFVVYLFVQPFVYLELTAFISKLFF